MISLIAVIVWWAVRPPGLYRRRFKVAALFGVLTLVSDVGIVSMVHAFGDWFVRNPPVHQTAMLMLLLGALASPSFLLTRKKLA